MKEPELADAIVARSAALNRRALERIYRNPFWPERFGERGRRFAEEDGGHHLAYLAEAMRQHDPAVLAAYACWLQSVLTTRGMCSLHIAEHFAELGRAIEAEFGPEAALALSYLQAAQAALRHDGPVAGLIDGEAAALAAAIEAELVRRDPGRPAAAAEPDAPRTPDDPLYYLSYLADGIANDRPENFAAYVAWVGGYLERRGVPRARLKAALDGLEATLLAALGGAEPALGAAIRPPLVAARAALDDAAR